MTIDIEFDDGTSLLYNNKIKDERATLVKEYNEQLNMNIVTSVSDIYK